MSTENSVLAKSFRHFDRLHKALLNTIVFEVGLYPNQAFLLFMLQDGNMPTQKEIANVLNVSPASIAVTLKRMAKSGLIQRLTDSKDTRCNRIAITEKGENVASGLRRKFEEVDTYIYDGFLKDERQQLLNFYVRMEKNIYRLLDEKNIKLNSFRCEEENK